MEYFQKHYPQAGGSLPVTERISEQVLCLPTNPPQPARDIPVIAAIIRSVHAQAQRVGAWIRENPDAT
jgi:dTDP-4-amino-4,6-dideoxygalactose transaminase